MKTPRESRIWIRPLLFLLFAGAFLLTTYGVRESVGFYLDRRGTDRGAQFLFYGWLHLLKGWQPGQHVSTVDLFAFQTAVMFLFSVLMLLPEVPLVVMVGGQIALFCLWHVFGDISLNFHAVEAWNVCLGAMFVAALGYWKGTRRDYVVAVSFGAVLGYFPLMRQSAIQTPAACLFILGIGATVAAVNVFLRWRTKAESQKQSPAHVLTGSGDSTECVERADWFFLRYLRPLAIFLACFIVMHFGATKLLARINHAPVTPHGTGYPLLMSVGLVNNPYNLVWDDDCVMSQGLLYERTPWYCLDPAIDGKVFNLWRARVLEDPGLIIRGVAARSSYLVRYFSGTLDRLATQSDDYPLKPSWVTLAMGIVFCGAGAVCAVYFFRFRNDRMLLLCAGTTGLLIASFLPLVILAPFYTGSVIAFCAAMILILLPTVHLVVAEARKSKVALQFSRNTLVYKVVGALVLALLVIVSGIALYRSFVNRTEARELLTGDPMQKLIALRYDFGFRFNRLSLAGQQQVVDRLLSPENRQLVFRALPRPASEAEKTFMPVLAIVCDGYLGVIAKMSRSWKMRLPSRVQGPRNSALSVIKNADRGPDVLHYCGSLDTFLKIADPNWDGRYRMFFLPAPPDIGEGAEFFGVSAHNFKAGDHDSGLVLDLISGDRLYRGGQTEPK